MLIVDLGCSNFAKRSDILNSLVDGALVIEVHLKLVDPTPKLPPFIPENPSCKIIQGIFLDEESSDIVFEVGGQQIKNNTKKKAKKTLSVTFTAHRLILGKCGSTLADLCRPEGRRTQHKTTLIKILDVSPDVFHHLLYHVYGSKVVDDDMKSHAKEIVDVAHRYGVVDLKLMAKAYLVDTTAFSIENLMDHLVYADSKTCDLLKEAALDFMLENNGEVLKKISFKDAPGALVCDVSMAMVRGKKKGGRWAMCLNELLWKAHKSGLSVDGSREMLAASLKAALAAKTAGTAVAATAPRRPSSSLGCASSGRGRWRPSLGWPLPRPLCFIRFRRGRQRGYCCCCY